MSEDDGMSTTYLTSRYRDRRRQARRFTLPLLAWLERPAPRNNQRQPNSEPRCGFDRRHRAVGWCN